MRSRSREVSDRVRPSTPGANMNRRKSTPIGSSKPGEFADLVAGGRSCGARFARLLFLSRPLTEGVSALLITRVASTSTLPEAKEMDICVLTACHLIDCCPVVPLAIANETTVSWPFQWRRRYAYSIRYNADCSDGTNFGGDCGNQRVCQVSVDMADASR